MPLHTRRYAPPDDVRPLIELSESGLLWLINRTVFHPRGLALGLYQEGREIRGWQLLVSPGEPYAFPTAEDHDGYRRAEATLRSIFTDREG
ncbi:hypothetical protein [Streptomyces sp. NPDC091649]|uniref:hypothetical protein n=1 Tax=Streptomyces sp. NPDC091649 TaxID=3366004 RepID=UPI003828A744